MPEINDRFVNVDFTKDPNYSAGFNGFGDTSNCLSFGDTGIDILPKDRWQEIADRLQSMRASLSYLIKKPKNQKNEGSCVGNGWAQGFQIKLFQQFGIWIELSAISLYNRIGSSPNSGAMVVDGLRELQSRGIVPEDNEENRAKYAVVMPPTGFSRQMPKGWEEPASRFKVLEAFTCRGVAEVVTCLLNGLPVIVGRDGHCIVYTAVVFKNGRLYIEYCNSWGEWGQAAGNLPYGFGYDTGSTIERAAGEAFAIRSVSKGYL